MYHIHYEGNHTHAEKEHEDKVKINKHLSLCNEKVIKTSKKFWR